MGILVLLLPLFFLVFGFGEIIKINLITAVNTGVLDFLIVLIVFSWVLFIKKTKYDLKIPILLFLGIALLTLVLNIFNYSQNQILISSLYFLRLAFYFSLYFVFVDIGNKFKSVIPNYMLLAASAFLTFGIFQYIFFKDLRDYFHLGWDLHLNRLFSTFFDPNFAGAFLVLIFIFVFILRNEIFSKKWIWISYIFLILNFVALILTYSRGAYLMFLVSVVSYSFFTKKWKLTAGIIGVFALIFLVLSPRFGLESTNLLRVASIEARIGSTKEAVHIYKQNPFGVGFNTYRYAREKYGLYEGQGNMISHSGAGVDNSYALVLATTGIIGLAAYLYLLFRILKLNLKRVKTNKFALTVVISVIAICVNALTINSLFYSYIIIWLIILIGFTESIERR